MKSKILTIILSVITGVLVLTLIYFVAMRATNNVPRLFGYSFLYIVSPSMETEIPVDTYILVEKVDSENIKVGDVISFYSTDPSYPDKRIPNTHRVVEILEGGNSFKTKGDNNLISDPVPASAENILGIYKQSLPIITKIANFFKNPFAFLILIILPAVALFFIEVINIYIIKKNKMKDRKP